MKKALLAIEKGDPHFQEILRILKELEYDITVSTIIPDYINALDQPGFSAILIDPYLQIDKSYVGTSGLALPMLKARRYKENNPETIILALSERVTPQAVVNLFFDYAVEDVILTNVNTPADIAQKVSVVLR